MRTPLFICAPIVKSALISWLGLLAASAYAATVTFDAVITAGGTETVLANTNMLGNLPSIKPFTCAGCTKNINGSIDIPVQFSSCAVDESKGNKEPGLTVNAQFPQSASIAQSYALDISNRKLNYDVTVVAKFPSVASYQADYKVHLKCPSTVAWQQTETKQVTVDSKNGYGYIADYTGPIGTAQAVPGSALVDESLFDVKINNMNPANADLTVGMFKTAPGQALKGDKLFAYYQPTHNAGSLSKIISHGNLQTQGGGIAIADIDGNGIADMLLLANEDLPENNEFTYQIGWDIDTNLNPKLWSPIKRRGAPGWSAQGASAAMYRAPVANAPLEVVFMAYDKNETVNLGQFRYTYGTIDTQGELIEHAYALQTGVAKYVKGAGVELYDIDNNGRPEIILSAIGVSPTQGLFYRIGWNLDASTGQPTNWSNGKFEDGRTDLAVTLTSAEWLRGGGVAAANLDRNPAVDLVFSYWDPYDLQAYTVTAWNIQVTGQPQEWGMPNPTGIYFPETTADLDIAIMDVDVVNQTVQRGALPIEKALVLTGTDIVDGVDQVHYSLIRHTNARDLVANGNFDVGLTNWHVWGLSGPFYEQGSLCGSGGNLTTNPWTAGLQTREAIPMEQGKPYRVQFDLWAPAAASVGVKVGNQNGSLVYGQNISLAVKSGWNRYALNVYMSQPNDYNAKLEFFLGSSAAPTRACVDNVRLYNNVNTENDFTSFFRDTSTALVKNGSFNFGTMAGWTVKSWAYSGMSTAVRIKNNEACMKVPVLTAWWMEALVQNNVSLESGAVYDLSFEAYAIPSGTSPMPSLVLKVGKDAAPFTTYYQANAITLSAQKTLYNYSFTMSSVTDNRAGLAFFIGHHLVSSEICLDNVSLKKR